jgi:Domain of unknown function (DUF4349)
MTTDEIERELHAMRPEPDPDFARRLDEWAAADFPPGAGLGSQTGRARERAGGSLRRVWERITSVPPRRILMPVGAAATVVVVAAVAITQSGSESADLSPSSPSSSSTAEQSAASSFNNEFAAPNSAGAGAEAAAPPAADSVAPAPDAGAAGGVARGSDQRLVDATARLSLGTEASKVQDVANQVVDVTDNYDGVVLDSQVTTDQGGARAAFSLEIPYKQLDAALSDLSGLADVISRTEGGEDITAKAVHSRRDLAGTLERIRKARIALIEADTRQERLVLKSQIASLNASADAYRTQLKGVQRQARFATVDVAITSKDSGSGGTGGGWSLDDALHDAGRVLEVIAGVGLVTLAVMLPVSVVLLLGWFVGSRTVRRRREAVLGS